MKVMLMAAGYGERMLPLTLETPKPLLKIGNKSLIQHQLEKLAAADFHEIVINVSWLGEQIAESLGNGHDLDVSITYSREEEPLDSAGGILKALPLLGADPFVCVNSDIWTDFPFQTLHSIDLKDTLAHLVLVPNPEQHTEGDFYLDEVSGLVTSENPSGNRYTFSGIAVYHPDLISNLTNGKKSIVPLLKTAMTQGKVSGQLFTGNWEDIGTPERLEKLDDELSHS